MLSNENGIVPAREMGTPGLRLHAWDEETDAWSFY
jgi:hypothetical protein